MDLIEKLEAKLDSFDPAERREALNELCGEVTAGRIALPPAGTEVNIHCHTFFSYNACGYSPTKFAWLARKHRLALAGTVDFDVLDAVDEFTEARRKLGLKGCCGIESRVFVPEFADKVMTSPGEPGITYHMGAGLPRSTVPDAQKEFLVNLKETAQNRNRDLMGRVNAYLDPVTLDYKKDVLVLTPAGNPTERHLCVAYARKAQRYFDDGDALAAYWSGKLDVDARQLGLPESRDFLNTLRAKTMKRGGVGYVPPDTGAFPLMADMNRFVAAAGGIPTLTWLDGTSDGEKHIEQLLEIAMSTGVAAINVIPDRNYTPGAGGEKVENLYAILDLAWKLDLVVVMGTEMNSPGQKFVDDFNTDELQPWTGLFLRGATIVYGHAVVQRESGLGYMSDWAVEHFPDRSGRNDFFEQIGTALRPEGETKLAGLTENVTPQEVLAAIR